MATKERFLSTFCAMLLFLHPTTAQSQTTTCSSSSVEERQTATMNISLRQQIDVIHGDVFINLRRENDAVDTLRCERENTTKPLSCVTEKGSGFVTDGLSGHDLILIVPDATENQAGVYKLQVFVNDVADPITTCNLTVTVLSQTERRGVSKNEKTDSTETDSNTAAIVVPVIVVVILILVMIIVAFLVRRQRQRKQRKQKTSETEKEEEVPLKTTEDHLASTDLPSDVPKVVIVPTSHNATEPATNSLTNEQAETHPEGQNNADTPTNTPAKRLGNARVGKEKRPPTRERMQEVTTDQNTDIGLSLLKEVSASNDGQFFKTPPKKPKQETQEGEKIVLASEDSSEGESTGTPVTVVAAAEQEQACTILIIGKTGTGKSSLGNAILGREAFTAKKGFSNCTKTAAEGETVIDNLCVKVVDTPDITALTEEGAKQEEIHKWKQLTKSGPDIVVLTISCDSQYTPDNYEVYKETVALWNGTGGAPDLKENLMIAFTFGEISTSFADFEDAILTGGDQINLVFEDAKKKYVIFEDKAPVEEKEKVVRKLIESIRKGTTTK